MSSFCTTTPRPFSRAKGRKSSQAMNKLGGFWNEFAKKNEEYQENNIFSDTYKGPQVLKKGDEGWGCPTGKTLERGLKAHNHITKEIQNLLDIMVNLAIAEKNIDKRMGGRLYVTFKQIFDRYVRISDKVVGILMRARKRKLIDFEGEMLWQGQDDAVRIYILKEKVEKSDPKWLGRKNSAPAAVEAPKARAIMGTHLEEDPELPSPPKKLALCSDVKPSTNAGDLKKRVSKPSALLPLGNMDRARKISSPAKIMSTESLQSLALVVNVAENKSELPAPVVQLKASLRQTVSNDPQKPQQTQPASPQELLQKQLSKESGPFKTVKPKPLVQATKGLRGKNHSSVETTNTESKPALLRSKSNSFKSVTDEELMPSPELKLGIYGKVTRELRRNKFMNMMAIFTRKEGSNEKVK